MPPRLAWFTPLPPTRSGIAAYSAELLPALADTHRIDVFVDAPAGVRAPGATEVHDAHDFVWKHARRPYDLIVYQLGNSPCHDYLWPYLVRYPGLAVLHDGQLHHARARALTAAGRAGDYRAEFAYNHPRVPRSVANLGAAGLLGALNYLWPMRRVVLDASRAALAHNAWLADDLRRERPELHVEVVEMGVPDLAAGPGARARARARLGVPPDAVLLAAFGKVTPEKRIAETLRALAALDGGLPPWRLMLCGEPVDHYDAREDARKLGLGGRVIVTGYVGEAEMPACIAAADVCLCLRWPSSRETSASWLRCLAAGKPTIVTDLVHLGDVPALDPRDWRIANPPAGLRDDRRRRRAPRPDLRRRPSRGRRGAALGARRGEPPPVAPPVHPRSDGRRLPAGARGGAAQTARRGARRGAPSASAPRRDGASAGADRGSRDVCGARAGPLIQLAVRWL